MKKTTTTTIRSTPGPKSKQPALVSRSLHARMIALTIGAAIPAMVLAIVAIGTFAADSLRAQARRGLQVIAGDLAQEMKDWDAQTLQTLHTLARQPAMASMDPAAQEAVLRRTAEAYPQINILATVGPDGRNLARNDGGELLNFSDRGWFREVMGDGAEAAVEVIVSRTLGKPALAMAVPIKDDTGRVLGVATATTTLDSLSEQVRASHFGETGSTFVVDRQGHVVVHSDSTLTGKLTDLANVQPVRQFLNPADPAAAIRYTGSRGMVAAAARKGSGSTTEFVNAAGDRWIACGQTLPNGWTVISMQSEDEVLAGVTGVAWMATAVSAIAVSVVVLLSLITSRKLTRPLVELTRGAEALAAGDWDHLVPEGRHDELGALARSFNKMVGEMRRSYQTIEQTVEERTAQLKESRERFELAVRGSSDGLWDWDVATNGIYYSPRWCEQVGYTPNELPQDKGTLDRLLHPADAGQVDTAVRAAFDGGATEFHVEFRLRHKDGSYRWILSRATIVRDDAGKAVRMVGSHTDITERLKSAEDLRRAEENYRGIFENAVMGIFQSTADGRYVSVNHALAKIYGYDSPEELKEGVTNIRRQLYVDPNRRPEFVRQINELGRVNDFESEIYTRDGQVRWIGEKARCVRGQDGRVAYYEGTIEDITHRKLAEEALRQAKRAADEARDLAEQASRAKSEFLANMSHEIRTPLNGVIGMTDLLLGTDLSTQQRKYAQISKASANALLSVISQILDFSKIEAGKLELETTEFDVQALVEDVTEMLAQKATSKGLELACRIEPGVLTARRGDPERLRQVLVNLVNNALKFTERGEVVVRVGRAPADSELAGNDDALHVTVTDTGEGVPQERMGRLFKSFSQVDASTTRRHGGTGLGLAISKQLIDLMGGRIGARSERGMGSTFWFTVPLAQQEDAATKRKFTGPRGTRVLVVKASVSRQQLLLQQFTDWQMEPAAAADGVEAMAALACGAAQGKPFAIVVIDSAVGEEIEGLATSIRGAAASIGRPGLLLLAGIDEPFDAEKARALGYDELLHKPLRQSQLFDAVLRVTCGDAAGTKRPDVSPVPAPKPSAAANAEPIRARILIAEDNEVNQTVATEILRRAGATPHVVGDGASAVKAVTQTGGFDLVLMDCMMPGLDGFDATRAIRRHEAAAALPRLPIVALTANAIKGDRERCLDAGMDEYLTKPLDPVLLLATIRRMLAGRPAVEQHPVDIPPSIVIPANESSEPFAVRDLLGRCMNDIDFVQTVLGQFRDTSTQQVERLAASVGAGDAEEAGRLAHALKGTAANLSATAVRSIAARLEALGKAGELSDADRLVEDLRAEVQRCVDYIPQAVRDATATAAVQGGAA